MRFSMGVSVSNYAFSLETDHVAEGEKNVVKSIDDILGQAAKVEGLTPLESKKSCKALWAGCIYFNPGVLNYHPTHQCYNLLSERTFCSTGVQKHSQRVLSNVSHYPHMFLQCHFICTQVLYIHKGLGMCCFKLREWSSQYYQNWKDRTQRLSTPV